MPATPISPNVRTTRTAMFIVVVGLQLIVRRAILVLEAPSFIAGRPTPSTTNGKVRSAVRKAAGEGEEEKDDGGFLKFMKVEQDIDLSPEEFTMALEQEIEAQRKRYYIGGVVKPNNLIVPWKPVDEKQLEKDARKQLKKNGIYDPSGAGLDEEGDSKVDIMLMGEQDVKIAWEQGEPGLKVGYIIERKRSIDTNFQEIASYEGMKDSYLLVRPYAGHEFTFTNNNVKPGSYTYRVLCRFRTGDIVVVDQKDMTVPEMTGIDNTTAFLILFVPLFFYVIYMYFANPPATL